MLTANPFANSMVCQKAPSYLLWFSPSASFPDSGPTSGRVEELPNTPRTSSARRRQDDEGDVVMSGLSGRSITHPHIS